MTEVLFWFLVVEALGLAAFPLACEIFRALPDRGYGLTKPFGILLVAFLNWWLGSVAGAANYPIVLWLLALLLFGGGLLLFRYGITALPEDRLGLALTIAVVGVAGVLAFSVSARTREFGIRLAVGSEPRHLLGRVIGEGGAITAVGIGAGLVCGAELQRLARTYFQSVDMPGAWVIAGAAGVLMTSAIVASAWPAMRAARVDVIQALRAD